MKTLVYNLNNEFFEEHFLKKTIKELLTTLTPKEATVLTLRFGLDDNRPLTLKKIGKKLNLSSERIRQIEAKALRKLRHPQRARKIKSFLYEERFITKTVIKLTEEGKIWVKEMEKYDPNFHYYEKDGSLFYKNKHTYTCNNIVYVEKSMPQHLWYTTEITETIYCE
jgi:DNA-binding CsgD family transcriptional regulator